MEDVKTTCTPDAQADTNSPTYTRPIPLPMLREFNGKKYYGAADVARIIGVTQKTVWKWQNELYMGAPLFTADERAHDGRYLYEVERVMQLKAVYHKDWMRGGYEENLTNQYERIEQAEQLFDLLFSKIPAVNFAYLWTKQDKKTYPFAIADTKHAMVKKAIELSDSGFDVYHCVNPVNVKPSGKRGDESVVAYQTACIVDIDIASDAHKQSDLAPSFDVAKSYLPFQPSILINSGYGLHAYYAFDSPIAITDENRQQIKQRNELLLDVVRSRSNGNKIDGVGDLPRILRTPGTFNYKLGKDNPPLCHIVEINDLRFTPEQLDEMLNDFTPTISAELSKKSDKSARTGDVTSDDKHLSEETLSRIKDILDLIADANTKQQQQTGTHSLEWRQFTGILTACKQLGLPYDGIVDDFCKRDPTGNYKYEDMLNRYNGLKNDSGYGMHTLIGVAKLYGYKDNSTSRADYIGTKKKIPSCPLDLKIPYGFTFSKHGISFVVKKNKVDKETGEQKVEYLPVANTPIIPTKIFFNPVTKTDEYEIAILSRGSWRFAEMTAPELYDSKALMKLASYGALVLDFKKLSHYFAEIIALNDIPQIKAYDRTGWTDDTCTEFIYPHEDAQYLLRRPGFNFADVFKPKGNREEWLSLFTLIDDDDTKTNGGGTVAHVAIGLMAAALLVRPLELPNLQAHIFGPSGIGKTALPKFGASIFGNPNPGGLTRTFSATSKNMLEASAAYCDLPLVLEEMETLTTKREEDLQQSLYEYEQGVSNQAQKRDGTSREVKRFFGSRISTGERPITRGNDKQGALKRILPLKCSTLFSNDFAIMVHKSCNKNYGLFGADWVRYIPEHLHLIRKDFANILKLIEQQDKKINDTHRSTLAISLAAYMNFKKSVGAYLFDHEQWEQNRIKKDVINMVAQLPDADGLVDYKRAIEDLKSFVDAHPTYFSHDMENPANPSQIDFISAKNTTATYGHKFINGEVAFYRTELVKILEKDLGYASGKKLIDDFCANGLLRHNEGLTTYRVRINGEQQRVVLFESCAFDLSEPDEDTGH